MLQSLALSLYSYIYIYLEVLEAVKKSTLEEDAKKDPHENYGLLGQCKNSIYDGLLIGMKMDVKST